MKSLLLVIFLGNALTLVASDDPVIAKSPPPKPEILPGIISKPHPAEVAIAAAIKGEVGVINDVVNHVEGDIVGIAKKTEEAAKEAKIIAKAVEVAGKEKVKLVETTITGVQKAVADKIKLAENVAKGVEKSTGYINEGIHIFENLLNKNKGGIKDGFDDVRKAVKVIGKAVESIEGIVNLVLKEKETFAREIRQLEQFTNLVRQWISSLESFLGIQGARNNGNWPGSQGGQQGSYGGQSGSGWNYWGYPGSQGGQSGSGWNYGGYPGSQGGRPGSYGGQSVSWGYQWPQGGNQGTNGGKPGSVGTKPGSVGTKPGSVGGNANGGNGGYYIIPNGYYGGQQWYQGGRPVIGGGQQSGYYGGFPGSQVGWPWFQGGHQVGRPVSGGDLPWVQGGQKPNNYPWTHVGHQWYPVGHPVNEEDC